MPKVSIILTSYNHAKFIGKSIESILNQTFTDFELYIVDDCSTDNSWKIINKYKKKDKRIITIRHSQNLGRMIEPKLIGKMKGEYIAIAHCDDMWNNKKLKKQVEFLDKNKDYAACFTNVQLIDEEDNEFKDSTHPYFNLFNQKNRSRYEWLHQFFYSGNVLCHPSVLIRNEAQVKYNLYAHALASLPDMYRWIKLCFNENIYVLEEKLTLFRIRNAEANTSGDKLENKIRYNFESFAILSVYYDNALKSEEEFFKIFPEANKFRKKKNNLDFIFAKMLIDMKENKPYQLYGLNIMYNILQSYQTEEILKKEYDYDGRSFAIDSSTIDIFGYKTQDNILKSGLYIDYGNDFSSENVLYSENYVTKNNHFYASYNLSNISDNDREIVRLRFDPNEGSYMCYKDIKIIYNGKELKYNVLNATNDDGWIKFNTSDPQIIIDFNQEQDNLGVIKISGMVKKRNLSEIDHLINKEPVHIVVIKRTKLEELFYKIRCKLHLKQ